MFPPTAILSLLLVVVSSATPIQRDSNKVTLSFTHQVNTLRGSKNLAEIDRDRAAAFFDDTSSRVGASKVVSVGVTNAAVTYTSQVGVGNPPVNCE